MRVVAFCAVAALIVGVVFGIAPAFQATSVAPSEAMGADSRTTTGSGGTHAQSAGRRRSGDGSAAVVRRRPSAADAAGGAVIRSRLSRGKRAVDAGRSARQSYPTPESLQQFLDQVEAEVRAVPGVADVGWSSSLPLGENIFGGEYPWHYEVVGDPPQDPSRKPITSYQIVSSTYFSTLELPIVAGRNFDARDARGKPNTVIVNEAFARTLGGRNPIGLRISFKAVDSAPADAPSVAEIVGVAKQVKQRPDEPTDYVQIYMAMPQDLIGDVMLLVQVEDGPGRCADLRRPRGDHEDRQGPARERVVDHDARGRGVGGDRAAPIPRHDGHRVCGSRGRARDGRRVRHPRLFGAATHA